ncbi:SAM-dependent methyltransferase [Catenuloplanes atrovinosus]|uniref:SAM-dependent methyltransferase n=1 Tax=Catenuloplanes atrovinosus TaxID=137266 RepID=A0AAE4CCQ5_9ACTN|nr:SAM-dependent methyltransferase [Catenuloplanes atrovinosus]MDR7278249.1 SAM-dependent methyltransferase [Catenuloplanes atrovinosus]
MHRPEWAPESIDIERPSVARMYDYYLGGSHNFAVDRAAAQAMIAAVPEAPLMAQANRAFMRRAVRYLASQGVRQFLDIGSGIPTVGNVHEIAQQVRPGARVAYADIDPIAVAHAREILAGDDHTVVIQADLRDPESIVHHPDVRALLDFDEPIAVLVVAVTHFIPDSDDPAGLIARLRDTLAPGSYLVLSQASDEGRTDEERAEGQAVYRQTDNPLRARDRATLLPWFDGFELLEPGLVWVPLWRPDPTDNTEDAERVVFLGGVGRLGG